MFGPTIIQAVATGGEESRLGGTVPDIIHENEINETRQIFSTACYRIRATIGS